MYISFVFIQNYTKIIYKVKRDRKLSDSNPRTKWFKFATLTKYNGLHTILILYLARREYNYLPIHLHIYLSFQYIHISYGTAHFSVRHAPVFQRVPTRFSAGGRMLFAAHARPWVESITNWKLSVHHSFLLS